VSATARATFAQRWRDAVAAVGSRPFLVWEDPEGRVTEWTYAEFDALVGRVAGGLAARGVEPGRSVHLALANSPAFVAVWLATVRLGAWIVPSDPKATAPEIAGHVTRTNPAVGVCATARAGVYKDGASSAASRLEIIEVDENDTDVRPLVNVAHPPAPAPRVAPRDPAAVMFTSGTTSAPKGVVVTQANYAFAGDVMAAAAGLTAQHRQLVVLPMFHANAQYYSFASAISVGASVALMHTFSASGFLGQAARHHATHASLFAAPMRMILARGANPVDGVVLEHCWYAQNVTLDQYEELARLFGCRPRQLYGMTETIPAVLTNRATRPIPDSMGVPTLGCEVELRMPESDDVVPDGEVGEVVVRGEPGITLFAGYLDDPDTTAASFRDGWFRTGDLARLDGDGNFFFAGRRSDVLKVAGENVSVVEVEAVLAEHASVLEAAVVGEPDSIRDEVPVGYVVQQPGRPPLSVAELDAWCEQRLSKVKRPVRIEVVDELPRTSVGKIRKFMLRRPTVDDRS
jgi:crotonobetaine/carnitine-CoA ligase